MAPTPEASRQTAKASRRGTSELERLAAAQPLAISIVLSKIGPRAAASCCCASATLRAAGSSEALWRRFCADDLGVDAPVGPDDFPLPSFKKAYEAWFRSFGMYPLPLVKRVKGFWTSFRSWLSENFPEGLETLGDGVSEAQIEIAESDLDLRIPIPTRVLYRFFDGQLHIGQNVSSHGIIGGYEFCREKVIVCLLSLQRIVGITLRLRSLYFSRGFGAKSNYISVGLDGGREKIFLLDCLNGQLYVGTRYLEQYGEVMPCVPKSLIRHNMDDNNIMPQDGLLLWLEEHLRRLQSGFFKVKVFNSQNMARHISIYPAIQPYCSSSVSHGVKVRVSAVFAVETSAHGGKLPKYIYGYHMILSLPEACIIDGKWHSSFMFKSYHWTIHIGENVIFDEKECRVHGKHPVLREGEELFVFSKFVSPVMMSGSMEGHLTLTPLRCRKPSGNQLVVKIDRFTLQPPGYIF